MSTEVEFHAIRPFGPTIFQGKLPEYMIKILDDKATELFDNDELYKNPKFSTLGKQPSIPKLLQDDFDSGTKFHRVETAILNVGANKESVAVNNSPQFYYAASATRYNLLFSQQTSITIPCNTDLEAGDVLNLQIEDISNKPDLGPDQRRGGRYIIKSLCHYFEPEKSVTSLVLIRDSYGLHTNQTV